MISTDTSANVTPGTLGSQDRAEVAWRDPRTASLGWLVLYLAVTAIALGASGRDTLAILHAAGILVAAWVLRPRSPAARAIGDLLPLVAAPLLYAEIPSLIRALGSSYHDDIVQGWELALFGTEPARMLATTLPFRLVSEPLHAGYLAYYPAIFAPALLLFVRGERRALGETVAAVSLTCLACWAFFSVWPVEGPRYLWSAVDVPDGPMRRLAVALLARGSSRGAAFPSSHMAVSVAQVVLAAKWQPRLAPLLALIAALVGAGAVYGGFHYGVDVIAGTIVGALTGTFVWWWFAPLQEPRSTR